MRVALSAIFYREETEEIGIGYIASSLREAGHKVLLSCGTADKYDINEILEFRPSIIGFTLYSHNLKITMSIVQRLKELLPETIIVVGGFLPSYYGKELLGNYPIIDYGIRFEGELVFRNLVKCLEMGLQPHDVKGLVYRTGHRVIENVRETLIENLDALPQPDRSMLKKLDFSIATMSTTRGCVNNCSFCVNRSFWDRSLRIRSIDNVISEMQELKRSHNIERFIFIDSSFEDPTIDRALELAERLIELQLDITYTAEFRADIYKKINANDIALMKESGLIGAFVGVESFNNDELLLYRKNTNAADNVHAIEFFNSNNLPLRIGFLNFNPYSNYDSLRNNVLMMKKYSYGFDINLLFFDVGLFKGLDLYQKVLAEGLINHQQDSHFCVKDFRYKNVEIERFHQYFTDSIQFKYYPKIVEFSHIDIYYMSHLQHLYRKNDEISELINHSINERKIIIREISDVNCDLFLALLELCAHSFTVEAAQEILHNHLSKDQINDFYLRLDINRNKLMRELYKRSIL